MSIVIFHFRSGDLKFYQWWHRCGKGKSKPAWSGGKGWGEAWPSGTLFPALLCHPLPAFWVAPWGNFFKLKGLGSIAKKNHCSKQPLNLLLNLPTQKKNGKENKKASSVYWRTCIDKGKWCSKLAHSNSFLCLDCLNMLILNWLWTFHFLVAVITVTQPRAIICASEKYELIKSCSHKYPWIISDH